MFLLGAAQTLAYHNCRLSLGGPLVLVTLVDVSCGRDRKPVYENGCKLNLMVGAGGGGISRILCCYKYVKFNQNFDQIIQVLTVE